MNDSKGCSPSTSGETSSDSEVKAGVIGEQQIKAEGRFEPGRRSPRSAARVGPSRRSTVATANGGWNAPDEGRQER